MDKYNNSTGESSDSIDDHQAEAYGPISSPQTSQRTTCGRGMSHNNKDNNNGDDDATNGPLETIAGIMGNVLEWYDFALFGYFSDVIGVVFFPPAPDGSHNLIDSFSVYGGAFLMRPIGGLVLGHFGDKYGRKSAVVPSLFIMAFFTFALGCLPSYQRVGSWSTALLVICRLFQGVSVGGQLPATLMYTVEMRPRKHWGFYGSIVMMGACIGTLIGNFVGAIIRSALSQEQLVSWGWRIPFLTGILNGGVAWFLHCRGEEHHPNSGEYDHDGEDETKERYPIRNVFKKENLPALLSAWLAPMLWGAGFYTSFVWMATYMQVLLKQPIENAFWVNAMALLFGVILIVPLSGILSDKIGRIKTMIIGAIGVGVVGPFMLWIISAGEAVTAFFAQWAIGVFLSVFGGPMNAWLVEKFPPKVRLTSAALGYDLAHCTASAFSPLVATVLVDKYGPVAPASIYPFFAVIAIIGMLISTKIHQDGSIEKDDEEEDLAATIIDDDLSTHLL